MNVMYAEVLFKSKQAAQEEGENGSQCRVQIHNMVLNSM